MDGLRIIQGKKLLKQRLDFPVKEKIETINRLAVIQGYKIFETTVRFSR